MLISGWAPFGLTEGGDYPLATAAELPFYGSLSSSSLADISIIDPYLALQVIAASKSLLVEVLIFALPVLILYAFIRGRVFCGWVCPANLLLEGVDFLRIKLKIKVRETVVPRRVKVWVALAVLLGSALLSVPLFEIFSPISAVSKGIVLGSTAGLLTFVAIVVVELFWGHRVWCRALCPLGGFYQVLGRVGFVNVHFDQEACTHCNHCKTVCLADPQILEPVLEERSAVVLAGDCMLCGKCVDVCPTKALKVKIGVEHFSGKS